MKQKPRLTILLTICLLSSLVGQQLTTTVPQRLEVRLRWSADQLGGDAIRVVILEPVTIQPFRPRIVHFRALKASFR